MSLHEYGLNPQSPGTRLRAARRADRREMLHRPIRKRTPAQKQAVKRLKSTGFYGKMAALRQSLDLPATLSEGQIGHRKEYIALILEVAMSAKDDAREFAKLFLQKDPIYTNSDTGMSALLFESWLYETGGDLLMQFVETQVSDRLPTYLAIFQGKLTEDRQRELEQGVEKVCTFEVLVNGGDTNRADGIVSDVTIIECKPTARPKPPEGTRKQDKTPEVSGPRIKESHYKQAKAEGGVRTTVLKSMIGEDRVENAVRNGSLVVAFDENNVGWMLDLDTRYWQPLTEEDSIDRRSIHEVTLKQVKDLKAKGKTPEEIAKMFPKEGADYLGNLIAKAFPEPRITRRSIQKESLLPAQGDPTTPTHFKKTDQGFQSNFLTWDVQGNPEETHTKVHVDGKDYILQNSIEDIEKLLHGIQEFYDDLPEEFDIATEAYLKEYCEDHGTLHEATQEEIQALIQKADKVTAKDIEKAFPSFYKVTTEKIGHQRGQGKRMGGMVMGAMSTTGLTIRSQPNKWNDFNITQPQKDEVNLVDDIQKLWYAQARTAGAGHNTAMLYADYKNHDLTPEAWSKLNKAINESTDNADVWNLQLANGETAADWAARLFNAGPKAQPIKPKTHPCPKCHSQNAYYHEAHPDTGYDEMVLRCPDCRQDSDPKDVQESLNEGAYQDFIKNGGQDKDWEAYAQTMNQKSKEAGTKRVQDLWKTTGVPGNDIVNLLRTKGIDTPEEIKKILQHNDTKISYSNLTAKGVSDAKAQKVLKWVFQTMMSLPESQETDEQRQEKTRRLNEALKGSAKTSVNALQAGHSRTRSIQITEADHLRSVRDGIAEARGALRRLACYGPTELNERASELRKSRLARQPKKSMLEVKFPSSMAMRNDPGHDGSQVYFLYDPFQTGTWIVAKGVDAHADLLAKLFKQAKDEKDDAPDMDKIIRGVWMPKTSKLYYYRTWNGRRWTDLPATTLHDIESKLNATPDEVEVLETLTEVKEDKFFKPALDYFGTTNNIREVGYILPGGTMLDLSGKNQGGSPNTRVLDHREVGAASDDYEGGTEGMKSFQSHGALRVDGNIGTMNPAKELTPAQEKAAARLIQHHRGEVMVDCEGNGERYYHEFPAGTDPESVLKLFRAYYSGKAYDGNEARWRFLQLESEDPATALANKIRKTQEYALGIGRATALYKARGDYDASKAPKMALHLVTGMAKKFYGPKYFDTFTPEVREKVMAKLAAFAREDAGKHNDLLPKKYQKDFKGYESEQDRIDRRSIEEAAQHLMEADNFSFATSLYGKGYQFADLGKHGRFRVGVIQQNDKADGKPTTVTGSKLPDGFIEDELLTKFDLPHFAKKISQTLDGLHLPNFDSGLIFAPRLKQWGKPTASGWMFPASPDGPVFGNRIPSDNAMNKHAKAWKAPRSPQTIVHEYAHAVWHHAMSKAQKQAVINYFAKHIAPNPQKALADKLAPTAYGVTPPIPTEWFAEVVGYSMFGTDRLDQTILDFIKDVMQGKTDVPDATTPAKDAATLPPDEDTKDSPLYAFLKSAVKGKGDFTLEPRHDGTVRIIHKGKDEKALLALAVELGLAPKDAKWKYRKSTGSQGGLVVSESEIPDDVLAEIAEEDEHYLNEVDSEEQGAINFAKKREVLSPKKELSKAKVKTFIAMEPETPEEPEPPLEPGAEPPPPEDEYPFELKDVQAYYDIQIAQGLTAIEAVVKCRLRFGIKDLKVNPVGQIMPTDMLKDKTPPVTIPPEGEPRDTGGDNGDEEPGASASGDEASTDGGEEA
jgi:hypothetical protein